jgi:hypothetical protein
MLSFEATQMEQEDSMFTEINQAQKVKYHNTEMISQKLRVE